MAGYFHFPLCLLAYGDDEKKRLHFIISYNVVTFARGSGKKLTLESLEAAQEALGVACEDPFAHENRWAHADPFVQRRERAHGKDAFVRIGCQLVWDCLSGALSYREFSLLCALNSVLGRTKRPKRITQPSLRVRAAGYKSWKDFQADVPAEQRKDKLLTQWQARHSLDLLHARKLFARMGDGGRWVFYLAGVSDEELRELVIQKKTT